MESGINVRWLILCGLPKKMVKLVFHSEKCPCHRHNSVLIKSYNCKGLLKSGRRRSSSCFLFSFQWLHQSMFCYVVRDPEWLSRVEGLEIVGSTTLVWMLLQMLVWMGWTLDPQRTRRTGTPHHVRSHEISQSFGMNHEMNDLREDVRSPVPARIGFHSKLKNRHGMTEGAIFLC